MATLIRSDRYEKLKLVAAGIKIFERKNKGPTDTTCDYRILQEGIGYIADHMGKRKIRYLISTCLLRMYLPQRCVKVRIFTN